MQIANWVDRSEYPFTGHYLDLPMGRMHYVDEGQGRPVVMVHDYGGPIGLSYAIDHPENIHSLVVMNTWMWSLENDPHFTGTQMFAGPLGRFLYERLAFSARVMLPLAMGDKSKLTRPIHAHYLKPWQTPAERHGTWIFAREIIGSSRWYDSLWQKKANLQDIPALILWGMKDIAFRVEELEKMKSVFHSKSITTFDRIGHFVAEELGDDLAPLVTQFLESYSNKPLRLSREAGG